MTTSFRLAEILAGARPLFPAARQPGRVDVPIDVGAKASDLVLSICGDEIHLGADSLCLRHADGFMRGSTLSRRIVPLASLKDPRLSLLLGPLSHEEAEESDIEAAFPDLLRRIADASSAQDLRTVGMEPAVFLHAFAAILVHTFGEGKGHPYDAPDILAGTPGGPASVAKPRGNNGRNDEHRRMAETALAPLLASALPTGWHVQRLHRPDSDRVCECEPLSLNTAAANRPDLSDLSAHERLELDILLRGFGVPT